MLSIESEKLNVSSIEHLTLVIEDLKKVKLDIFFGKALT